MGFNRDRSQMKGLFTLADVNNNGKIDEREFCEFWVYLHHHNQPNFGQGYSNYSPSGNQPHGLASRFTNHVQPTQYNRVQYDYPGQYNYQDQFMHPRGIPDQHKSYFDESSVAFRKYDTNHSGKINRREFRRALRYMGYKRGRRQVKGLFAVADINHNGKLDEREFCEFWVYLNHHNQPNFGQGFQTFQPTNVQQTSKYAHLAHPTHYNRLQYDYPNQYNPNDSFMHPRGIPDHHRAYFDESSQAFRKYDSNRSGYMSYREFKHALRHMGYSRDRNQMQSLWSLADRDNNGRIDEREFCEFWVYLHHHNQPNWGQGMQNYTSKSHGHGHHNGDHHHGEHHGDHKTHHH